MKSIQSKIKIGITGHRNLADEYFVEKKLENIISRLIKENEIESFEAYTSVAYGADTLFARIAKNKFKADIKIVLPFPEKEFEKDFDTEERRDEFNYWCNNSTPAVLQNDMPTSLSKEWRNEAYFQCGKYIVDQCDVLIAVWNRQPPAGHGGTAEIVAYAYLKTNTEVIIIDAESSKKKPLLVRLKALQKKTGWVAETNKKYFRLLWKVSVGFAFAAVLLFAIRQSIEFESENIPLQLLCGEFACVVLVLVAIGISKRLNFHKNFLESRLKAEKLRLQERYFISQIPIAVASDISKADADLLGLAKDINEEILTTRYKSTLFALYSIKQLADAQYTYHENRVTRRIGVWEYKVSWFLTFIVAAFIANLLLHLFSELIQFYDLNFSFHYPHSLSVFCSIVLPALYAAVEAMRILYQWKKLKEQSESMKNIFKDLKNDFDNAKTSEDNQQLLDKISKAMLAENEQWQNVILNINTPPVLV